MKRFGVAGSAALSDDEEEWREEIEVDWNETDFTYVQQVLPMLEQRRAQVDDRYVQSHDATNANGEKVAEIKTTDPEGGTQTTHVNLSTLLTSGISTTSNMEIILIEAKMAAEGDFEGNPHLPSNDRILEQASRVLGERGLTPAWELANPYADGVGPDD